MSAQSNSGSLEGTPSWLQQQQQRLSSASPAPLPHTLGAPLAPAKEGKVCLFYSQKFLVLDSRRALVEGSVCGVQISLQLLDRLGLRVTV